MKLFKKKMTLTLAIILVLTSFTASFAAVNMSDLNEVSWAKQVIEKWAGIGLVSGYVDGTFKPGNAITRAEFTVIAYNAFELESTTRKAFDDVKTSDWFYQPVSQMAAQGFINGYGDGSFKPNAPITRAEAAIILVNIQGLKANPEAISIFEDAGLIPPWAAGYIGAAFEAKNISGYPDGTFRPNANITRAESVVMLDNAIYGENTYANNWILNEPGVYGSSAETTVVEGNVYLRSESISLTNFVIKGDLIIGKEVAEGTVSLNTVTVQGDTEIYGGGMNSIYVRNSKLGNVMVLKANQLIRIVAVGNSTFGTLTAYSGVKLEESNIISTGGFGEIIIEAGSTGQIILEGNFSKVTIRATGVEVVVPTDTVIAELNIEARVSVTGNGTIDQAIVDVNGVTFETAPTEVLAGTSTNVTVTIGGEATEVTQAPAPAPIPGPAPGPSPGGGTGGDGGTTPPPVDTKKEYGFSFVKDGHEILLNEIKLEPTTVVSFDLIGTMIDFNFDFGKITVDMLDKYTEFVQRVLSMESEEGYPYAFGMANRIKNADPNELQVFKGDVINTLVNDVIISGNHNATYDQVRVLVEIMAEAGYRAVYTDLQKLYPGYNDPLSEKIPSEFKVQYFNKDYSESGYAISNIEAEFYFAMGIWNGDDFVRSLTLQEVAGEELFRITFGDEYIALKITELP
ncbi:MAG: S-layer homology domain-containing protein [Clostridiales bacterium]|nr:S-layer homology domain-containing protein [Clostridiales bacterium]